jgi:hypothetical protein
MHIRPHSALRVVLLSALAGIALPLARAADPAKPAEAAKTSESGKTHAVTKLGIKLNVPESWKSKDTNSNMHLMQFSIPKGEGDKDDTEVSLWYFGLNGAGSVNENFQRWIDEFDPKDRKLKITTGKCPGGEYILMDISGTWDRKVPTPQGGLKVVHTTGREIAVAVTAPHSGDYFYRLMGPETTVAANVDAFRAAIGADAKNEKDYKASSKVTAQKPVVEKPVASTPKPAQPKPDPAKPAPAKAEPKK